MVWSRDPLSRRRFLELGAAGTAVYLSGCAGVPVRAKRRDQILINAYSPKEDPTGDMVSLVNLDTFEYSRIPIPRMDAHGFAQHPVHREVAAVFGRNHAISVLIDVDQKKILRTIDASKGRYFYGHGNYSPDGKIQYATEYDIDGKAGAIVMRDAQSMKILGEFPSFGILPHETYLSPDGKTMVAANQGFQPSKDKKPLDASLCYIDCATGKLLHKIGTDVKSVNFFHLAVDSRGQVAIGADCRTLDKKGANEWDSTYAFHPSPMIFGNVGMKPVQKYPPGEAGQRTRNPLSLAISEQTRTLAVTCPYGGALYFWNLDDHGFKSMLSLDSHAALGVAAIDGGSKFAANTISSKLLIIDAREYKVLSTKEYENHGGVKEAFRGPHLMNLT